MVEAVIERLARLMRGRWLAVAVTAILAYFGYHALHAATDPEWEAEPQLPLEVILRGSTPPRS